MAREKTKSRKKSKKRSVRTPGKAQKPKRKRAKKGATRSTRRKHRRTPRILKKEEKVSLGERLHHLLTESSVVVYAAKPSGDYAAVFISDNVERLTGYSYRSFVRNPSFWIDHVHPEDRERVLKEVPAVFEDKYYEYEYRFRHKKGHYICVHDEMKLVCDDKGKPLEIIGYWRDITRRRKAEKDLEKTAEKLQRFMDSATEGFVLFDKEFHVVEVNKYLLHAFGLTREQVIGMNYLDVSSVVYESGRYEEYLEVLETGRPKYYDDLVTPPEYGSRHICTKVFKVGDYLGMVVNDVTEERKAERVRKVTEERLRSIYDSINAGIVIHDLDGVVVSTNEHACEILNLEEDEIIGADVGEICGDIVNDKGEKIDMKDYPLGKTLQTNAPVRNQIVGLPAGESSQRSWVLVNTEPIFDPESHKLAEVLCTFVDITEQKNIGDALEESEQRYRHLFEHSPIGIGISGMDGKVITANSAMLEIMGYTLDEVREINIADTYVSVDDRRRLLQALNQYGRVTDYRVRLKRKDGTPYDAILNISRVNIGGNDYYHTMCQRDTSRNTQ